MPDFGIFRGFNDKLFGDKLYAGQLPTQLGLIGSASFGFDVDALAFFARVTTAGGTLSPTEQLAIDTLVRQMKLDGIWTKMKAIYPMVGASDAACKQNLKSSSFTGTFNGGWTFASSGIQGNGTNAYMDTGFNSSIEVDLNSHAYGIYLPNNYSSGTLFQELGAYGPEDYGTILYSNFGGLSYNRIHSNEWNGIYNTGNGFTLATRTASNITRNFLNGVFKIASTLASTSASAYNYYIGARGNNGSGILFSPKLISFVFLSDGLTDEEAGYLYNAVQAFQTTLSRQV
jgi:hypothetical protein